MLRELADHIESLAIAQAHALNISWDTIAGDLTVTRQSLHGRYVARPSQELQQRVQDLTGGTLTDLLNTAKNRHPLTPPPAHKEWPRAIRRALGDQLRRRLGPRPRQQSKAVRRILTTLTENTPAPRSSP
ncbi:hypothetical protein ACFC4G_40545 [Streptomyces sp. NPDC056002]|uniref:hypothetical protein n=1 Tax=Streptomyces sp. NPDC056002 TaxID=3345675 RepID=UPI0035D6DD29